MKKLSLLLLLIIINISAFAVNIKGTIKIEGMDSLGVFVYVENENKYDISDSKGKFTITGLKIGEEYTLVFQKGNLPDYRKKIKTIAENTNAEILIAQEKVSKDNNKEIIETIEKISKEEAVKEVVKAVKVVKIDLTGKVNSVLPGEIFLQLSGQSNGIIVKPNSSFKLKLKPGTYKGSLIQEGAITKKISFVVGKSSTFAGTFVMEALDYNNLTIKIKEKVENGVLQIFKEGYLEYSNRINKDSKDFVVKGLKKGDYDLVIKATGKKEYIQKVSIAGNTVQEINFEELNKENKIFVDINPKDIEAEVRVLYNNELVTSVKGKDLVVIEALDYSKNYELEVVNPKYKKVEIKRVATGDNIAVNLVRFVKGSLVSGYISPFNSNSKVMILDNGKILGETVVDETGYYEIELEDKLVGEKNIRVSGENFEEYITTKKFDETKTFVEENLELKPFSAKIDGKVSFDKKSPLSNVLVMIEELGIWQYTNDKGEYFFNNVPEGTYEVTFKKLGYSTKQENFKAGKDETSTKDIELVPIGKIVFRSNIEGYKLTINGNDLNVNEKIYEYITGMGPVNITAIKNSYLPISTKIKLTEAGEIRDINLEFINTDEQNKLVKNKIEKIKDLIKDLQITEAEELLLEISNMKQLKVYERDYLDIKGRLKNAKSRLFDIDRNIKFEIEKVKENIRKVEIEKIGYTEKSKKLSKLYKESVDYLEKIILSHPYTTFRYDIHLLQSDVYLKLGMTNSAKNAKEEASKYESRRKE